MTADQADPLRSMRKLVESLGSPRNRLVAVILAEDLYDAVLAHCEKLETYACAPGPEFQIDGIDLRKEKYLQPGHYMPLYQRADGSQTWDENDTRTIADRMAQARYERERYRTARDAAPEPNAGAYLREITRRLEESGHAPEIHPTDFSIVEQIEKETK